MTKDEIAKVTAMARHLCEKVTIEPGEQKYSTRIWNSYVRIVKPVFLVDDEATCQKQFDAAVKTYFKETK